MAHGAPDQQPTTGGVENRAGKEDPSEVYIQFVKEEQRLKQEDILSLQEYSLEERVERFRAMGPLRFMGKELDHEGKFRYNFSVIHNNGTSKFREGDF